MDVVSQYQFDLHIRDCIYEKKESEKLRNEIDQLQSRYDELHNRFEVLLEQIKPMLSPMELRKLGVKWVQ